MRFHRSSLGRLSHPFRLAIGALALCSMSHWTSAQEIKVPPPPETRREEVKEMIHGVQIVDPYRWLEDAKSPETRKWLETQMAYTNSLLRKQPGREALVSRLEKLMKTDAKTAPSERNGRYFFMKRSKDQDLFSIVMREKIDGADQVLIDPHSLSQDKRTSVSMIDLSADGKTMAYGLRKGGEDEVEVRLFDIEKRQDLDDKFPRARYTGMIITKDKKGVYYAKYTPRGPRVLFHTLGNPPEKDTDIFGDRYGAGIYGGISGSDDAKHMLIIASHGSSGNKVDLFYKNLEADEPIKTIVDDVDARFTPAFVGDKLLLTTNWNAPNNRVMLVDLEHPSKSRWREVIPESKFTLQTAVPCGGKIFAEYLENVTSRVRIFGLAGNQLGELELPGIGSVAAGSGKWDGKELFYTFQSFNSPATTYRYDVETKAKQVWYQPDIPVDTSKMEVNQIWYPSKDGTKIPMFLVHKKGIKLDGKNATYLTGYGGFNVSRTAVFSTMVAEWVNMGGVFALPNLRGGGEFGEAWHMAGMFEKKQNVFDDFHAAGDWLIANGYTSSKKLAVAGGSNGGLLVGATITQRPDLAKAIVCSIPLLDMIRYQQFLVARFWVSEFGSSENPDQFKYILAYSPYHNVVKGTQYPSVMFVTGDADTRVDPCHARKMTAMVQWANASSNPILLHYDVKAGHSQGQPIRQQVEDLADQLSYLYWQLGVKTP